MGACAEYEERLSLHAAGALEGEAAAQVRAHLETCAACRAEAADAAEVLGLVALPARSPAETREWEALPARTQAAWRRERSRRDGWRRAAGGFVAAAAGVALMLAFTGRAPLAPRPTVMPEPPAEDAPLAQPVDTQTLADFEAWAGLEPLTDEPEADDGLPWDDEDGSLDLDMGETL
ncbi:zf-HC2 domain-containing protein [Corallococcus sp. H22C18031201]|nr:zf-HC2 domain-containing protein [Corallococcus sp. H22C18031201]